MAPVDRLRTVLGILFASFLVSLLNIHAVVAYGRCTQANDYNLPSSNTPPNSLAFGSNATAPYDEVNFAYIASLITNAKHYGGAFFLAVDDLNQEAAERGIPVRFTWTFCDINPTEMSALHTMANLFCEGNVSAFIGPDAHCSPAGMSATAYDIPFMAFSCHDSDNDTARYQMVNTSPYFGYVSRYIVEVLKHFEWTSAWIVSGEDLLWSKTRGMLTEALHKSNITVNGQSIETANDRYFPTLNDPKKPVYRDIIRASKDKTRVYIFLGHFESLKLFLRKLRAIVRDKAGEYAVVVAADASDTDHLARDEFYFTHEESHENLTRDITHEDAIAAFQNVIIVQPMSQRGQVEEFEERVEKRNYLPPINRPKPLPFFKDLEVTIPQQAYSLYDATKLYGRGVMNIMEESGNKTAPIGHKVITWLRMKWHDSVKNTKLFIHKNGDSEDSFIVQSLVSEDGVIQPKTREIGNFSRSQNNTIVTFVPDPKNHVAWISNKRPVSMPVCGFKGELCPQPDDGNQWTLVFVVVILLVMICIPVYVIYQRRKANKLKMMSWKIESSELELLSPNQVKEMMTPARPRKKKTSENHLQSFFNSLAQTQEPDVVTGSKQEKQNCPPHLGIYKGNRVYVKLLSGTQGELPEHIKKKLQLLKEITHENINRFIGVCIDPLSVSIVSQYCPRKSLQDILEKDDSPLDDMFKTSIVQDLINGMTYIHESEFICHGNLKSSNCLVDSRWTVKIADFGLDFFKPSPRQMDDDTVSCRDLLWTAPELLPNRTEGQLSTTGSTSSNSHGNNPLLPPHKARNYMTSLSNTSTTSNSAGNDRRRSSQFRVGRRKSDKRNMAVGSPKGDVYSFAIILYELYGSSGPWGNTEMTNQEIINGLLNQRPPTPRPDVKQLTCDNTMVDLIQACWHDDPDVRPDFKDGVRTKFRPIQQLLLSPNIIDNMLAKMEKYTDNLEAVVAERTEELRLEKKMTDNLLLRMLPRSVAEKLKRGQRVPPEQFEQVTIYFSDIVGFTEICADSTPMEVIKLLNELYTCFDSVIERFDVYKVETIGDAYMVVSGLPIKNGDRHAGEIASMALQILEAIKGRFIIGSHQKDTLKIRIGIHSGPCCAGVVGLKMPRYCLFGDTINTANRLESTGEALKIHCSGESKAILDKLGGYHLEERGYTAMKGKGSLLTYFLVSEDHIQRQRRISQVYKTGQSARCVSASNLDYSGRVGHMYPFGTGGPGNLGSLGRSSSHLQPGVSNRSSFPFMATRESFGSPTIPQRHSYDNGSNTRINSNTSLNKPQQSMDLFQQHQNQLQQHQQEGQQKESEPKSPSCPSTPSAAPAIAGEFQFLSSSLPRSHGNRPGAMFMSPIAEDPVLAPAFNGSCNSEDPTLAPPISRSHTRCSSDSGACCDLLDRTCSVSTYSPTSPRSRLPSEPLPPLSPNTLNNESLSEGTSTPRLCSLQNLSLDYNRSASYSPELMPFQRSYSESHRTSVSPSPQSSALRRQDAFPFPPEVAPTEIESLLGLNPNLAINGDCQSPKTPTSLKRGSSESVYDRSAIIQPPALYGSEILPTELDSLLEPPPSSADYIPDVHFPATTTNGPISLHFQNVELSENTNLHANPLHNHQKRLELDSFAKRGEQNIEDMNTESLSSSETKL